MDSQVRFRKTGKEIKEAIGRRVYELEQRLARRNATLDNFMQDSKRLRSYLVRNAEPPTWSHARGGYVLVSKEGISSEEVEEITQLCRRIFEIEQELHRLSLISTHLSDKQIFDLTFEELVAYGFEARLESK